MNDPVEAPDPVMTLADFRRLPIPAGVARIQPPNLRTLVNVETNVFVDAQVQLIPTQLLGIPVQVRATPREYAWDFGDGQELVTSDPGAAYPDLRTTHVYAKPGKTSVTLTTRYGGEYSVDGGPWLPIVGEAEVASAPANLTVIAARSELVAEPLG